MKKRILTLYIMLCAFFNTTIAQQPQQPDKMEWFKNARFGVFIHWGIYAVDGITESWSFYNKRVTYPQYMKQLQGFTASNYHPEEWAELIRNSGARYAVITSKHHDGVALWNTKANNLSVPKMTPAKRDVLTPFVDAIKKAGIKNGLYFSLIDWSHPDYPAHLNDSNRYKIADDPGKWERYNLFMHKQLDELRNAYNPDLWWFDGDWEHSADEWHALKIREKLLSHNPRTIINGRLQGYGDYATPEQHTPVTRPKEDAWELCMTINRSWGYQPLDTVYKTPKEILTMLVDAASMGGNILLSIGPKADGSIPEEHRHMLTEIGKWNKKNGEAIFDTKPGIPPGHFYGPTTLSADSTVLYLFLTQGKSDHLMIKGLRNEIKRATVLGTGVSLEPKIVGKISWSETPGLVFLHLPDNSFDEYITVVKLELDKPVGLYRGKGGFYE